MILGSQRRVDLADARASAESLGVALVCLESLSGQLGGVGIVTLAIRLASHFKRLPAHPDSTGQNRRRSRQNDEKDYQLGTDQP